MFWNHENVILHPNITHILADLAEKYKNVSVLILPIILNLNILNMGTSSKDVLTFVQIHHNKISKFCEGNKNKDNRKQLFALQDIEFIGRTGPGFVLSKPGRRLR